MHMSLLDDLDWEAPEQPVMRAVIAHELGHVAQIDRYPGNAGPGGESSANWWAVEQGFGEDLKAMYDWQQFTPEAIEKPTS